MCSSSTTTPTWSPPTPWGSGSHRHHGVQGPTDTMGFRVTKGDNMCLCSYRLSLSHLKVVNHGEPELHGVSTSLVQDRVGHGVQDHVGHGIPLGEPKSWGTQIKFTRCGTCERLRKIGRIVPCRVGYQDPVLLSW